MSWPGFLALFTATYFGLNALFALLYLSCGPGALHGHESGMFDGSFIEAFFFSIQTFATIGYGDIIPVGRAANAVVTLESFASILMFALATGLVFARFSRPRAQVRFSERAVIAPYGALTAFEFRVANVRRSELIEVEARVIYTFLDPSQGILTRQYCVLPLERTRVTFFPLTWTVVHPIDAESPLYGITAADLVARHAEFLVLITGVDEAVSQPVHTRASYHATEVTWGARFVSAFLPMTGSGRVRVDLRRLSELERAL